jgi:hypothetical protein
MRIRRQLTYANVMSTIAVIIAVAGGSTAVAVTVNASKKSDINKKGNIRPARVTTPKIAGAAVTSPKLAAIDVVQASSAVTIATAICSGGERLIGGGGLVFGGASLAGSWPDGNGWSVASNGAATKTAYALCLK